MSSRLLRRWAVRAGMLTALAAIASTQTGCIELALLLSLTDDDSEDPPDEATAPEAVAPEVEVQIADWPPIGPSGYVEVQAATPNGVSEVDLAFRNQTTLWGSGGTAETFRATGTQLGEGLGSLSVTVVGGDGATTEAYVEDLLVDLTPPEIVLGPTTLPARDASFDFWMGDAWVLGRAELAFGGTVLTEELPPGYPQTLGTAWDYSLVRFDVASLPAITGEATLTVTDAAGNVTTEAFTLSVDGAPPVASFLAPAAGTAVRGDFEVEVEAYDAEPGPLVIELYAGGAIVATGSGPTTTFTLSADDLGDGPLELEAVATDEAGNRSAPTRLEVVVDHDVIEPPAD